MFERTNQHVPVSFFSSHPGTVLRDIAGFSAVFNGSLVMMIPLARVPHDGDEIPDWLESTFDPQSDEPLVDWNTSSKDGPGGIAAWKVRDGDDTAYNVIAQQPGHRPWHFLFVQSGHACPQWKSMGGIDALFAGKFDVELNRKRVTVDVPETIAAALKH